MLKFNRIGLFVFLTLIIGVIYSSQVFSLDENITTTSFAIGTTYDSDSNIGNLVSLDHEFSGHQHIMFNMDRAENNDDSVTSTISFALASSNFEDIGVTAEFSYSKTPDSIEVYTGSGEFAYYINNWQFTLAPQLSTMTLLFTQDRHFNMHSIGPKIGIDYFWDSGAYVYSSYSFNQFSDRPVLRINDTLGNLGDAARQTFQDRINERISGFEKQSVSLTLGRVYYWGSVDANLSYAKLFNASEWLGGTGTSLEDDTFVSTYWLSVFYELSSRFSVSSDLGVQIQSITANDLYFVNVTLFYFWE